LEDTVDLKSVIVSGRCKFAAVTSPDIEALLKKSEQSVYALLRPDQKELADKLKGLKPSSN
jgi:hypothetical protein